MSQVQIPNSDHCIWRAQINHLCKSGLDPIDCKSSLYFYSKIQVMIQMLYLLWIYKVATSQPVSEYQRSLKLIWAILGGVTINTSSDRLFFQSKSFFLLWIINKNRTYFFQNLRSSWKQITNKKTFTVYSAVWFTTSGIRNGVLQGLF